MTKEKPLSMESIVVQACHYIDAATGGVSVPIQTSTTYARDENYELMVTIVIAVIKTLPMTS